MFAHVPLTIINRPQSHLVCLFERTAQGPFIPNCKLISANEKQEIFDGGNILVLSKRPATCAKTLMYDQAFRGLILRGKGSQNGHPAYQSGIMKSPLRFWGFVGSLFFCFFFIALNYVLG